MAIAEFKEKDSYDQLVHKLNFNFSDIAGSTWTKSDLRSYIENTVDEYFEEELNNPSSSLYQTLATFVSEVS
jgi:hypothetical protein